MHDNIINMEKPKPIRKSYVNAYFFMLLLFGITVSISLLTPNSTVFGSAMAKYGDMSPNLIFDSMIQYMFNWNTALSFVAAASLVALSGLNLIVILPLGLTLFLLNYFVFPTELLSCASNASAVCALGPVAGPLVQAFFTIATIIVIASFIRSG